MHFLQRSLHISNAYQGCIFTLFCVVAISECFGRIIDMGIFCYLEGES